MGKGHLMKQKVMSNMAVTPLKGGATMVRGLTGRVAELAMNLARLLGSPGIGLGQILDEAMVTATQEGGGGTHLSCGFGVKP